MRGIALVRPAAPGRGRAANTCLVLALPCILLFFASAVHAANLKTMTVGLGSGTITAPTGINCGLDCDESFPATASVTLTATPAAGSTFVRWQGDCAGTTATCTLGMSVARSVRAVFAPATPIPALTDLTPEQIDLYLDANPSVDTAAEFIAALPADFRQDWIMMSRSESLQTGVAEMPRFLLPSADARAVFTFGLLAHESYPGSHPKAIEYMQWDAAQKNFRFHEIVLAPVPAVGTLPLFPDRERGVSIDDDKCSRCHSTRNVFSSGSSGTTPGSVQAKNKPNWDTYDSWAGMLPLNRDRIYQGSVEAAGFRRIFNPWTWRDSPEVRAFIEQLELQPPTVTNPQHAITRVEGGANDGHVNFGFDVSPPVLTEPLPNGSFADAQISYSFDGLAGTASSNVERGGAFLTLHHSSIPSSDEGRGIRLFDALGGLAGNLNQSRVADEVANHSFATGSVPIDVRPIALAVTKGCLEVNAAANSVTADTPLTIDLGFFDARNGLSINELVTDTRSRAQSIPRRKADLQRFNLERTGDVYLLESGNGLIQEYGAATAAGTSIAMSRLRQEVFRRPVADEGFVGDSTVMGGFYVDREIYGSTTETVALFRYFLEPLGVSVDRWSMGVRGRGRTYSFADIFSTYLSTFTTEFEASLTARPVPGLAAPFACDALISAVNSTLAALPEATQVPTYTDVQRIWNKACVECHGGLNYPPFSNFFPSDFLDFSENDTGRPGGRLDPSYDMALNFTSDTPETSLIFQRITQTGEECPNGMMPCGGPPLSRVDIETLRRWIIGGRAHTEGDPHLKTIDGVQYDFQAAGEFTLLLGEGFELQARQTAVATEGPLGPDAYTGLTSCVSLNSAVALRVGPHRITYQPAPENVGEPTVTFDGESDPAVLASELPPPLLQLRIDGVLTTLGSGGVILASGARILPTSSAGGIQIQVPGGTDVVVTPGFWDYYRLWYLNVDVRRARATQGVIGAIAPNNWLPALPDGQFLGPQPSSLGQRYDDLYGMFAESWRVTDASSLFDYGPGESTDTFTVPEWPGSGSEGCFAYGLPGVPNRPPPPEVPFDAAQAACNGVTDPVRRFNCEQDVMVTGHVGFAGTYIATDRIDGNRPPHPAELISPDNNATNRRAGTVTFTWKRKLKEKKAKLRYELCVWPLEQPFGYQYCQDTTPSKHHDRWCSLKPGRTMSYRVNGIRRRQAYYWKVIATDDQGGTTESETRRFATR